MNLEYRIVGAAKNSEEDLRAIYDEMGTGVYTLALSLTRSRKLAREVAVGTVNTGSPTYAPSFRATA